MANLTPQKKSLMEIDIHVRSILDDSLLPSSMVQIPDGSTHFSHTSALLLKYCDIAKTSIPKELAYNLSRECFHCMN